jgi:hypothetical protein
VRVFPDAEIGRGDAAFWDDGGGFKDDQARAALGAAAEVDAMPIGGEAVLRGVLAHGRNADAVGKGDGTELKGGKERMTYKLMDDWVGLGMQRQLLAARAEPE